MNNKKGGRKEAKNPNPPKKQKAKSKKKTKNNKVVTESGKSGQTSSL